MDIVELKNLFETAAEAGTQNSFNLSWEQIHAFGNWVLEIGETRAVEMLWEVAAIFGGIELYNRSMERKRHKKALAEGKLDRHECTFEETMFHYLPAKDKYVQRVRPINDQFEISKMFDVSVRKKMMQYIDRASKLCTSEKPVVFSHLHEVIDAKEYDVVMKRIASDWRNYFYKVVQPGTVPQSASLKPGESYIEGMGIPLLVYEPDPYHDRYRAFWINPDLINEAMLPPKGKVIVECDYEEGRWNTLKAIITQLQKEPWLIENFSIPVTTGMTLNQAESIRAISLENAKIIINPEVYTLQ